MFTHRSRAAARASSAMMKVAAAHAPHQAKHAIKTTRESLVTATSVRFSYSFEIELYEVTISVGRGSPEPGAVNHIALQCSTYTDICYHNDSDPAFPASLCIYDDDIAKNVSTDV